MPKSNKKTILIVEDEAPLLKAVKTKLELSGFSVITAEDGLTGLDLALTKKPDLILLDIIMPKMDGMSVLQKLRKNPAGKNIPVIVLTNLSDADKMQEAEKRGVHDFLIKSDWRLEDVVSKVKERLA
jgi:response regulator RpfG family c-di-GMP phosphodiesterase